MPRKQFFSFLFVVLCLIINPATGFAEKIKPYPGGVKAIYLSTDYIFNKKKIAELEEMIKSTKADGIVIDYKDSNALPQPYMISLVERFHKIGAYTIARVVTFQDSRFARLHPEIAVKRTGGSFWWSGAKKWRRYWLDPASTLAQDYNIKVAKLAIDAGFDEIQFDYIRFPTDGNMRDIRFPIFNPAEESKSQVMIRFFRKLYEELKIYSPNTLLGIDVFGEVFLYGRERGIGQDLNDIAKYFDVISPMAYPSHYQCGEFKVKDPNAHPYLVYQVTLKNGLESLKGAVIIRPWIQSFNLASIYGCGPRIIYDAEKVQAQIKATRDLGISGFMLWNVNNVFPREVFK